MTNNNSFKAKKFKSIVLNNKSYKVVDLYEDTVLKKCFNSEYD